MSSLLCDRNNDKVCKICASLNYRDDNMLKQKENVARPFKMFAVPSEMLQLIIEKMDLASFARMRRTSKEHSEFIDKHRHKMRIALFHTMQMTTGGRYASEVEGAFVRLHYPDPYTPAHATKFGNRHSPTVLTIYLKRWKCNEQFRREFTGVFHNSYVNLLPTKSDRLRDADAELLAEFLNSARMTKMNILNVGIREYSRVLELVKPECCKLNTTQNTASKFFLENNLFKTVKHLSVFDSDFNFSEIPMHILQTFEILDRSISTSDLIGLLKDWISGKSSFNEFTIRTRTAVLVEEEVECSLLPKEGSWKYCKQYMWPDTFRKDDTLKVYLLKQLGTGKEAVCILTNEKDMRFKVISDSSV